MFLEVVRPERLVTSEKFDHAWYEGECIGTVTLMERAGKTTLTMNLLYDSRAVRDPVLKSPMSIGMEAGFAQLDALLASKGSH